MTVGGKIGIDGKNGVVREPTGEYVDSWNESEDLKRIVIVNARK